MAADARSYVPRDHIKSLQTANSPALVDNSQADAAQMIPLQVLSNDIDGTKDTKATWTTPNVTPNSKIYFLQL